jgi:hypothetical protein
MEERRGLNLGCVVAGLGLVLSCCLLPYLISSVYSVVGALVNGSQAPTWLWGELANQLAGESNLLYILLTESPICCVGTVGLLVIILGVVLLLGGAGQSPSAQEQDLEVSPDEPYAG